MYINNDISNVEIIRLWKLKWNVYSEIKNSKAYNLIFFLNANVK